METIQTAKKIGGSLMIRIPKDIVENQSIKPGEKVKVDIKKLRKDWFGTVPGLKPFDKNVDRARSKYE